MSRSVYMLTLAAVIACASSGSGTSGTRTHREPNLITEQEIAASGETNALDVVTKLRPMFLKTRGRSTVNAGGSEYASVFVDGQFYGELGSLRNINVSSIHEIRYLNGPDAVSKYGMRYGSGAVDVRSK
ncbi:MAG TPA: hypothetical protein VK571_06735 [Gemmatimonadaceae bacterium]|jgi:hypothetical protein|nr:hypothetical protein [Gemmatimonadaceae bacterium]